MRYNRIYVIIFLFFNLSSIAQAVKNKVMMNTSFGSYSKKINNEGNINRKSTRRYAEVNLNIGYYLSNNFAVGCRGEFQRGVFNENRMHSTNSSSSRKNINNDYSVGMLARYQQLFKNKLGLFAQFAGTYNWGDEHNYYIVKSTYINSDNRSSERTKGTTISITPGVIYFITNKFSMETSMGDVSYNYTIKKQSQEITSKFGLDFSVYAIKLGFSYYFGERKKEEEKHD